MAARFLSVAELADELGIARSGAYRLLDRKALPAVRVGKRLVVERCAVEAFIAAGGEQESAA